MNSIIAVIALRNLLVSNQLFKEISEMKLKTSFLQTRNLFINSFSTNKAWRKVRIITLYFLKEEDIYSAFFSLIIRGFVSLFPG